VEVNRPHSQDPIFVFKNYDWQLTILILVHPQQHQQNPAMLFCPYCANNLTIGDGDDSPDKCW